MGGHDRNAFVSHCAPGQCWAGVVGTTRVQEKHWHDAVQRFEGKIELWNELTKRHAIPHIGFVQRFNYCTECGKAIDHDVLSPDKIIRELADALLSGLVSTVTLRFPSEETQKTLAALAKARAWLDEPSYAHLFESGLGEMDVMPGEAGQDQKEGGA